MKTKMIIAAGAIAMLLTGCDQFCQGPKTKTSLVTEKEKYSYALGAHFGNQAHFQLVTRDSIDLDIDLFIQAFKERYMEDSAKFLMNMEVSVIVSGIETKVTTEILALRSSAKFPDKLFEF